MLSMDTSWSEKKWVQIERRANKPDVDRRLGNVQDGSTNNNNNPEMTDANIAPTIKTRKTAWLVVSAQLQKSVWADGMDDWLEWISNSWTDDSDWSWIKSSVTDLKSVNEWVWVVKHIHKVYPHKALKNLKIFMMLSTSDWFGYNWCKIIKILKIGMILNGRLKWWDQQ